MLNIYDVSAGIKSWACTLVYLQDGVCCRENADQLVYVPSLQISKGAVTFFYPQLQQMYTAHSSVKCFFIYLFF